MQKKDEILDDTFDTTLAEAEAAEETEDDGNDNEEGETAEEEEPEEEIEIEEEVFAGVLVNNDVPTITRQLDFLANIVKRALLLRGPGTPSPLRNPRGRQCPAHPQTVPQHTRRRRSKE